MPRPSAITYPRLARSSVTSTTTPSSPPLPDHSPVKAQLERIVGSRAFDGAHRSQLFLQHIVHHTVTHPAAEPLKEYSIAIDVFDRDVSYDPAVNNAVRVEAGRLRSRLLAYYAGEGRADPLLIEIPRGHYRAVIRLNQPPNTALPQSLALVPAKPASAIRPRFRHLWAVPLAFALGALIGYRASH